MEEVYQNDEDTMLQQKLDRLLEQQARDQELQQLLDRKTQCIFRKVEFAAQSLADQTERDKAALSRVVAAREFDLTKSKVDLLRWRQRSALLKVQLSSAEEDVRRYQRVGAILQRQYELERGAKVAVQRAAAAEQAVAIERGRQQAVAWRTELESAQAGLEERQRCLGDLHQELVVSLQREAEMDQQLAVVRAQLVESAASAGDRMAVLQQEASQLRADYVQLEKRRGTAEAVAAQRLADAEELRQRAKNLQQEVAFKSSEIAALQVRLSAEKKQVADLKAQVEDKRARIALLEEQAATRTVGAFVSQLESPLVDLRPEAAHAAQPQSQEKPRPAAGRGRAATALHGASAAAADVHRDNEIAAAQKRLVNNAQGQRKRKAKVVVEQEPKVAAEAAGEGSAGKENALAAAGRPRRDRGKAQPYWMGPQQPEGGAGSPVAEQPAAQEQDAADEAPDAEPEELALALEGTEAGPPAAPPAKDNAAGDEEEDATEEGQVTGGRVRRRGKRKAQPEQPSQEAEAAVQVAETALPGEAKAQKGKGRKGQQLKRPQGEIKTNLTSVWGGATPVPADSDAGTEKPGPKAAKPARKSNLGPKSEAVQPQPKPEAAADAPEAAGSSQYHQAPVAGVGNRDHAAEPPRGSQGSAAASQPEVASRIHERPLGPLNQRTLAAAANMLSRPAGPFKTSLQKAIAARGESSQQQPQKRKLMPVSTAGYAAAGDVAPTDSLFGGFKGSGGSNAPAERACPRTLSEEIEQWAQRRGSHELRDIDRTDQELAGQRVLHPVSTDNVELRPEGDAGAHEKA